MIEENSFNFQRKIVNTFNEETSLPFLLKYYLLKEIWETVERQKILLDKQIQLRQNEENSQEEEV